MKKLVRGYSISGNHGTFTACNHQEFVGISFPLPKGIAIATACWVKKNRILLEKAKIYTTNKRHGN